MNRIYEAVLQRFQYEPMDIHTATLVEPFVKQHFPGNYQVYATCTDGIFELRLDFEDKDEELMFILKWS